MTSVSIFLAVSMRQTHSYCVGNVVLPDKPVKTVVVATSQPTVSTTTPGREHGRLLLVVATSVDPADDIMASGAVDTLAAS
jgi:hypothetical protein